MPITTASQHKHKDNNASGYIAILVTQEEVPLSNRLNTRVVCSAMERTAMPNAAINSELCPIPT
ncbi:hypothetical protein SBF1_3590004 [Candidatus Desulfosporosinus infrequens]|uniref:Uncharacterized protein n=1 Tax=Candidatus Desulfosporosinus infrequens TaxID=2043169 RepID=A0A2U3L3B4_9FIRM|nr:hypothetical protein SBF1_3590004 [Candidatus Desulfosporosinus infrequens]